MGTAYYVAPEVLAQAYTEAADVWSSGVIMYIMLCGAPPFNADKDSDILRLVKKGQYSMESGVWRTVSTTAKSLIKACLEMDHKKRITAQDALSHEWPGSSSTLPPPPPPRVFPHPRPRLQGGSTGTKSTVHRWTPPSCAICTLAESTGPGRQLHKVSAQAGFQQREPLPQGSAGFLLGAPTSIASLTHVMWRAASGERDALNSQQLVGCHSGCVDRCGLPVGRGRAAYLAVHRFERFGLSSEFDVVLPNSPAP